MLMHLLLKQMGRVCLYSAGKRHRGKVRGLEEEERHKGNSPPLYMLYSFNLRVAAIFFGIERVQMLDVNTVCLVLQAPVHPLITSTEMLKEFVKEPEPVML